MDKKISRIRKVVKNLCTQIGLFSLKIRKSSAESQRVGSSHYHENEVLTTHKSSGVPSIGARGRVPPLTVKKLSKIGKKEEKLGRKGQNREGSFTLPLLTNRAGYATAQIR